MAHDETLSNAQWLELLRFSPMLETRRDCLRHVLSGLPLRHANHEGSEDSLCQVVPLGSFPVLPSSMVSLPVMPLARSARAASRCPPFGSSRTTGVAR
jgi:hypothetical protein